MDILCDQSLFSKQRRARVYVYPYKRVLHYPVEHEGLLLPELHWEVDKFIQQESAMAIEAQKMEEIQIPDQIQREEQVQQITDPDSNEMEINETVPEVIAIDEDQNPYKRESLPEGIARTSVPNRFLCLYCQEAGEKKAGKRLFNSARSHKSQCKYNPKRRSQRHLTESYSPWRTEPWSERKVSSISGSPSQSIVKSVQPSPALVECWVMFSPKSYGCRACLDNGEEVKTWTTSRYVWKHFKTRCKYVNNMSRKSMDSELPDARLRDAKITELWPDQTMKKGVEVITIDESEDEETEHEALEQEESEDEKHLEELGQGESDVEEIEQQQSEQQNPQDSDIENDQLHPLIIPSIPTSSPDLLTITESESTKVQLPHQCIEEGILPAKDIIEKHPSTGSTIRIVRSQPWAYDCLYCRLSGVIIRFHNLSSAQNHRTECLNREKHGMSCVKKEQECKVSHVQEGERKIENRNKSTLDNTGYWMQLAPNNWVCKLCYDNGEDPLKSWTSKNWVRNHWIKKCKYNSNVGADAPHVELPKARSTFTSASNLKVEHEGVYLPHLILLICRC